MKPAPLIRSKRPPTSDKGSAEAAAVLSLVLLLAITSILMGLWGGWSMNDHMRGMMAGGRDTADAPLTSGGAAETVRIKDFLFSPGNLRVPVGATVTWRNEDGAPHTATARDRSWDTGVLAKGEQASLRFDEAGNYAYYCAAHPDMKARLQVQ